MQSEIISLFFKTRIENYISFKAANKTSTIIKYLYSPSKQKSYDKTRKNTDGNTLGHQNCQDIGFLVFRSAFAFGGSLSSALAFPSTDHLEAESSSTFKSSVIQFWSQSQTRLDEHSQPIIIHRWELFESRLFCVIFLILFPLQPSHFFLSSLDSTY